MATTYQGPKITSGIPPRALPWGCETVEIGTFTITAAFVINDIIQLVKIASNPSVTGNGPSISSIVLDVPSLDSSTGIVTAVGDSGTAGRFISGATVGRSGTGGIQGANVSGTYGYQPFLNSFGTYTTVSYSEYVIQMKITTAATGTAATSGTIALKVGYTIDP